MPEYIPVPGPVEYWYPPEELMEDCVPPGATPLSLGLMAYGMDYAQLAGTVTVVWHQYTLPCNEKLKAIRSLAREHQAGTQNAE